MSDGRKCQNCGSVSQDPEWCDVCGADLSGHAASDVWLEVGQTVRVAIAPQAVPETSTALPSIGDDTLPPPGADDDPGNVTMPGFKSTIPGSAALHYAVTAEMARHQTGDAPTVPDDPGEDGTRELELELDEMVSRFGFKRVFRATDTDGAEYRVEERSEASPEAVPEAARALGWLVDVPLGAAQNGGHEIKVYRSLPGETMHQRLEARDEPMTPSEIVDWMRPVAQALKAIHDAGFLCLRLCPYTVKFTGDGIFLQGVEVLYPQDTALEKLPAIAGYTPPEVYAASVGEPPTVAADIYMAGMMVYYLIARADPPASMYTAYTPTILARDIAPDFPLGFAPVLGLIGAADPVDRPRSAEEFLDVLEHARDRSVRQIHGIDDVRVAAAADTHAGIIKRMHAPTNQDTVFCETDRDHGTALMMVADGVSTASYGSGDQASAIARTCAERAWRTFCQRPEVIAERGVTHWLDDLLQTMNRALVEAVNDAHAPFEGEPSEVMGSTCVIAFVRHGICHLASLGDSRAYLLRDGFMEQVNRDHNLLTLGIAQGLDPDTALTLPQGDALAKCLGAFDVDGGRLVAADVEPDTYVFPLLPGDRLLLCSDGLTDYAGETIGEAEARIYEVVMEGDVPDLVCLDLIRLANFGGGGDNIGCALAIADPTHLSVLEWFASTRDAIAELGDLDEHG